MADPTQTPAWKVGDVVTLNSGGPPMRVFGVARNGAVACEWDDEAGTSPAAVFPAICVMRASARAADGSLFLL